MRWPGWRERSGSRRATPGTNRPAGSTRAAGIGIGSTNDEIRAAYPEGRLNTDETFGSYWEIDSDGGTILIFINGGSGSGGTAERLFGGRVIFCD